MLPAPECGHIYIKAERASKGELTFHSPSSQSFPSGMSCRPGRPHVWPGSSPSLSSRMSPGHLAIDFCCFYFWNVPWICRLLALHGRCLTSHIPVLTPALQSQTVPAAPRHGVGGWGVLPLLWLPICCPPIPLPWSPSLCLADDHTQAPSPGVRFSGTLWKLIRPALASSIHTLHAESTLTHLNQWVSLPLTGWPAPGF